MVTREEILWAYRAILGREPENETEYVWHSQHSDFDELRRNIISSSEGSAHLQQQLGAFEGGQPLDSIIDEPGDGYIKKRIAYFSGFVQSSEPVPPVRIIFDSKPQEWLKTWSSFNLDAPWNRRFTTYWSFRYESPVERAFSRRQVVLEVFAGKRLVKSHLLRPKRNRMLMNSRQGAPLTYFLHIEKTAGTSLRSIINNGDLSTLFLYNHIDFLPEDVCRSFSRSAANDLNLIYGHFPFGLHSCFERRFTYASIVRRPIDLIKSYYLFVKYVSDEHKFRGCKDIFEAIDNVGDRVFDNIMVRYFSGNFNVSKVSKGDYDCAMQNVTKYFSMIGLSEEFERSARAFCDYLGVPYSEARENTTPETDEAPLIDPVALEKHLGDRVGWDARLYDNIANRWYARC